MTSGATRITLHVKPRSKETKIIKELDDSITMHVSAPPTKGKANREILKWISKKLRRPSSHVRIVSGIHSNIKVIEILEITEFELAEALGILQFKNLPHK